jgi:hypothetical protein
MPELIEPSPGGRSFCNPISMRYVGAGDRWDGVADTLYGGIPTDDLKNDHGLIAATAHAQVRGIL